MPVHVVSALGINYALNSKELRAFYKYSHFPHEVGREI